MGIIICIFIGLIWLTFMIIVSVHSSQMINILNEAEIPTCYFGFIIPFNKFKKFIDACSEDKKIEYTKLYKRALWFTRVQLLLFVVLMVIACL